MMIRFAAAGLLALIATGWGEAASADDICRRKNIGGMHQVNGTGSMPPTRVEVKFQTCGTDRIIMRFAKDLGGGTVQWTSWQRAEVMKDNNGYVETLGAAWNIGERYCRRQTSGIVDGLQLRVFHAYVTWTPAGGTLMIRGRGCHDNKSIIWGYSLQRAGVLSRK